MSSPDAELTRQHGDDAAAHPALGGHADGAHPVARGFVHPTCHHDTERALHHQRVGHPSARRRGDAATGQRGGHPRKVCTGDVDRALAKVDVQHVVGIAFEHPEALQHVGDRAIAVAGQFLRGVYLGVEVERTAREP